MTREYAVMWFNCC